jgi:hypothetical protein
MAESGNRDACDKAGPAEQQAGADSRWLEPPKTASAKPKSDFWRHPKHDPWSD